MSVILESVTNKIIVESDNKISIGINALQNSFRLKEVEIEPHKVTEIIDDCQKLYLRLKQAPLLALKLNVYQGIQSYLIYLNKNYQKLLPQIVVQEIKELELQVKASINLIAAQSSILTAFLNSNDTLSSFKEFYLGLNYLQSFVKFGGNYLSDDAKKILPATLENTIDSDIFQETESEYIGNNSEKKDVNNQIKLIRNLTKAILWDVNKLQPPTSTSRFKNVDELWSHWDKTYTESEVEESLELLEGGIDSERRQQNGRTLFS